MLEIMLKLSVLNEKQFIFKEKFDLPFEDS